MKKIMLVCAAILSIGIFTACNKEDETSTQPAEELILGSWKVTNNHIEVEGDSIYEWDNKLVGRYYKFCSDSVGGGIVYIEGNMYCTYVVTGDKIYFSKGQLWSYRYDGDPSHSDDSPTYTIESISKSKLKIVSNRWGVSGSLNGEYISVIEFERL